MSKLWCRSCRAGKILSELWHGSKKQKKKLHPHRLKRKKRKKNTLLFSGHNILYLVAILSLLVAAFYGYRYVKPLSKPDPHAKMPMSSQIRKFDQEHYQHLQDNLKSNPDGFKENVDLANFLFDNQRHEEALNYYLRALQIDPHQPDVLVDAGVSYFNLRKLDEARDYFEKALEIDNKHINALYNMGVVSAQMGNMTQMIAFWERLIEVAPESEQAKAAKQMLEDVRKTKP